jgi:hypothetical protein
VTLQFTKVAGKVDVLVIGDVLIPKHQDGMIPPGLPDRFNCLHIQRLGEINTLNHRDKCLSCSGY